MLPAGVFTNGIAYSPAGTMIAIARSDGTAWLLDARTLRPAGPPFRVTAKGNGESVAFSPDGKLLATAGDDGTVRLWSLADPARPRQLATVHDSGSYVYTVVFAPDGRTLAAASTDNLTRLWDVADPARPVLLGRPLAGRPATPSGSRSARIRGCSPSAARTRRCGCGTSATPRTRSGSGRR